MLLIGKKIELATGITPQDTSDGHVARFQFRFPNDLICVIEEHKMADKHRYEVVFSCTEKEIGASAETTIKQIFALAKETAIALGLKLFFINCFEPTVSSPEEAWEVMKSHNILVIDGK